MLFSVHRTMVTIEICLADLGLFQLSNGLKT